MAEEEIEAVLADFRSWLREHGDEPLDKPVDVLAVVDEFTALRHEVKLLTKATRGQSEQVQAVVEKLDFAPVEEAAEAPEELKPALLAVLEALDTLDRSIAAVNAVALPERSSWWRRTPAPDGRLTATAEGLQLSRQRILAALQRLECEPVAALDEPFDPETMEALEAIARPDTESGTVIEEIRTGFIWRGKVLRYAQVRVAK